MLCGVHGSSRVHALAALSAQVRAGRAVNEPCKTTEGHAGRHHGQQSHTVHRTGRDCSRESGDDPVRGRRERPNGVVRSDDTKQELMSVRIGDSPKCPDVSMEEAAIALPQVVEAYPVRRTRQMRGLHHAYIPHN